MKRKTTNAFPFLGMIWGFLFGAAWLYFFWDEVSGFVPQHSYRFGAIGILGFPIVTALLGIIIGKVAELLSKKFKK